MYFPYLRGREEELRALRSLPAAFWNKSIPVVEAISPVRGGAYGNLIENGRDIVLVSNSPYTATTLDNIAGEYLARPNVIVGHLVEGPASVQALGHFIQSNKGKRKAVIFRSARSVPELDQMRIFLEDASVEYVGFCLPQATVAAEHFADLGKSVAFQDGFIRHTSNKHYE